MDRRRAFLSSTSLRPLIYVGCAFACMAPLAAHAATVANPLCPTETALFNPGNGQDIVVPKGFKVSVFASGLNFPTGIAFRGIGNQGDDDSKRRFEIFILE